MNDEILGANQKLRNGYIQNLDKQLMIIDGEEKSKEDMMVIIKYLWHRSFKLIDDKQCWIGDQIEELKKGHKDINISSVLMEIKRDLENSLDIQHEIREVLERYCDESYEKYKNMTSLILDAHEYEDFLGSLEEQINYRQLKLNAKS